MEANSQTMFIAKLGDSLKRMESSDKVILITAANKYNTAKRSNGNIGTAYNELLNVIKMMGDKYGFNVFEGNSDVQAVIDGFAAKVEQGMNTITGQTSYTCNFRNLDEANRWLAGQSNIVIKRMSVATSGAGHQITGLTLEYMASEQPLKRKYQLTTFNKTRLYAKSKPEKVIRRWQEKNPQFACVNYVKKDWAFRLWGGRVGYFRIINEKYILLYAFNCQ